MIVIGICKILYSAVERFLRLKPEKISTFVFERVEVALHRRVVVWTAGSAHALSNMNGFAVINKRL